MNMPILTQNNPKQSIDSDEISLLVDSRSDNVKRAIERLAIKGVITLPPMEEKQTAGRPAIVYVFSGEKGKRDSIIVVAQLCPEFTARLVDRWQELERNAAHPVMDLNNPEFLRQALLGYTEKVIELEHKVQKLEPKAQALDDIAATTSTFCIRDAAKTVGVSEKVFIQFLLNQNWVYRSKDGYNTLVAYGKRINQKVMAEKVTRVIETSKGPQVFTQARITSKGLTRLAAMVRDAGLVEGVAA